MPFALDDTRPRNFANSVEICFREYFQFSGRAPRAEYWYFALFSIIVNVVSEIVAEFARGLHWLNLVVSLALLLPGISVAVRRLHDIDRTGWWYLLIFLPIIGWIILFIWACTRGTRGPNRYGADPLPDRLVMQPAAGD